MRRLPPAPAPSSVAVHKVMQGNRGSDTRPEVALRSALHRMGLRFRKNARPQADLRCRADLVFRAQRIAVFVDGCYWHRCPTHGVMPSQNSRYWRAKLDRNVERGRRKDADLTDAGWTVVRVWEHEPVEVAANRVAAIVASARSEKRSTRSA